MKVKPLNGSQLPGTSRKREWRTPRVWIYLFLCTVGIALLLTPYKMGIPRLRVGDVAPTTIRAPFSFLVLDKEASEARRRHAVQEVPLVFDLDRSWYDDLADRIAVLFERLRGCGSRCTSQEIHGVFKEVLGVVPPPWVFRTFQRYKYGYEIEAVAQRVLYRLSSRWIVDNSSELPENRLLAIQGVLVKDKQMGTSFFTRRVEEITTVAGARHLLRRFLWEEIPPQRAALRKALYHMLAPLIRPTFHLNLEETEAMRSERLKKVQEVYLQVKKGEVIVREGEVVTETARRKLQAILHKEENAGLVLPFFGRLVLVFVFMAILLLCWPILYRGRRDYELAFNLMLFSLVVGTAILRGGFALVGWTDGISSGVVNESAVILAVPFAFTPTFCALLFSGAPALISVAIMAAFSLMLPHVYPLISLVIISVGCTSFYGFNRSIRQKGYLFSLSISALGALGVTLGWSIWEGSIASLSFVLMVCAAITGIVLLSLLVYAFLPVTEFLFGIVTDIGLLRLANLDHPLMQQLLEKAPGTYNHSIHVANLAEAAARAVNANSHLAKVGGYYHDIGKIKNPSYFIENTEGKSKHDTLSPSMSRLIILSHVKEGIELAKRYRLPRVVQDIIEQHHGTTLIRFFYNKAVEQMEEEEVTEETFRYPGPIPQFKEAAIVMMADSVEAASKTLEDPSPSRIKGLVRDVVNGIFLEGQLEDCDLTLRDIHVVMEVFSRMLTGLFHRRVKYPDQKNQGAAEWASPSSTGKGPSRSHTQP